VVNLTPQPLYTGKNPDAHRIYGWVGSRAGLDGSEEEEVSFLCRDLNLGPFSVLLVYHSGQ
jgi:hypothetical protein